MRWVLVLGACLAALGCESSGGGGDVTPGDSPRIVESFTCRQVDSQARPVGITQVFLRSEDDRICVWAAWEHVDGAHTAQAAWFDSDGSKIFTSDREFTSPTGEQITWFFVNPAGMSLGRWEVELWLDGAFHRSHFFMVEE